MLSEASENVSGNFVPRLDDELESLQAPIEHVTSALLLSVSAPGLQKEAASGFLE